MKSIYFLKNDLRLIDNRTLIKACETSGALNFIYCLDDDFNQFSSAQKNFIYESLSELHANLKKQGTCLKLFIGEASDFISTVEGLSQVYQSKVYNSKDLEKQANLRDVCSKLGLKLKVFENATLYDLDKLPFDLEKMPRVFTNFRKKIENEDLEITSLQVPDVFPKNFDCCATEFQDFTKWPSQKLEESYFKGGESEGQNRLKHYLWNTDAAQTYKETRNGMIEFDDSTKFSPWLAVGCLSPRNIMTQLKEYESERGANDSTYWIYFELLWRDYFKLYSLKFGKKIFEQGGIDQKNIEISLDQENLFTQWTAGQTGNDFIDANMNELRATGWMSNRGRQNVASYLSKELLVDWRKGAKWFAQNLVDYDVESNWGNWNYVAGVGVDPRDRKFNISRQAEIYDPQGTYVEKFVKKC